MPDYNKRGMWGKVPCDRKTNTNYLEVDPKNVTTSSGTFTEVFKERKYTNFTNEIETEPRADLTAVVVSIVLGLLLTLAIVDLFFSETVTEVISELFV